MLVLGMAAYRVKDASTEFFFWDHGAEMLATSSAKHSDSGPL